MMRAGDRGRKRSVGSFRGLRGGSWNHNKNNLRSSNRNNNNPDNENNNIGFRVASPWKGEGGFGFESIPPESGPESAE
jgi:formylglycine-generating enzyme required for sulfatase activity